MFSQRALAKPILPRRWWSSCGKRRRRPAPVEEAPKPPPGRSWSLKPPPEAKAGQSPSRRRRSRKPKPEAEAGAEKKGRRLQEAAERAGWRRRQRAIDEQRPRGRAAARGCGRGQAGDRPPRRADRGARPAWVDKIPREDPRQTSTCRAASSGNPEAIFDVTPAADRRSDQRSALPQVQRAQGLRRCRGTRHPEGHPPLPKPDQPSLSERQLELRFPAARTNRSGGCL